MRVRCEQSGRNGEGAGVMGFAHAPGGEQSALSQGPPLGLSPTPRPSPLSTRWRGRGGGRVDWNSLFQAECAGGTQGLE